MAYVLGAKVQTFFETSKFSSSESRKKFTFRESDIEKGCGKPAGFHIFAYFKQIKESVSISQDSSRAFYTFVETLPWTSKRNPHVFRGKYITITRQDNGTLRLNFRPVKMDGDFSPVRFALGVSNELMWALEGLVEEK